jgi:hypothetical protein
MLLTLVGLTGVAAALPGTISGVVRDSRGAPQMGAMVQILPVLTSTATVLYTDVHGQFRATGLKPGHYSVKVSAVSFLPTIRERLTLRGGAEMVVNLTLNTIFEAIQMVPHTPNTAAEKDDWRWTLRSMANRPILRLVGDGPLVVVRDSDAGNEGMLKARVSLVAGGSGETLSASEMSTQVQIEQELFHGGRLGVGGSFDAMNGGSGIVSANYRYNMPDGSTPEVSITAARYASPELLASRAALETLALRMTNTAALGRMDLEYGAQMQAAEYVRMVQAVSPFVTARIHLNESNDLVYSYSGLPSTPSAGYGQGAASLLLGGGVPRASLNGRETRIEKARHQELSLARRQGKARLQVGVYTDNVHDLSLAGLGSGYAFGMIPDSSGNAFLYNGGSFSTQGVHAAYQRNLLDTLSLTTSYAFGGALDAPAAGSFFSANQPLAGRLTRRHTASVSLSGTIPSSRTQMTASYRWTSGSATLTGVDGYSTGVGQSGPFLDFSLRQPLPRRITQCNVEVLVDVRNLLAQGYRPVLSSDGETLYLVQMARTFRGGLSFTF